jgi:competence protein ComEC
MAGCIGRRVDVRAGVSGQHAGMQAVLSAPVFNRIETWVPPWPSAIVVAAMAVHQLPQLPSRPVLLALLALGLLLIGLGCRPRHQGLRYLGLLIAAAAGICWRADLALASRLSPDQEGVDFVVRGVVASMPLHSARGERFVFRIEDCAAPSPAADCPAGRDVRLSWYRFSQQQAVAPGERWQFNVRLKRPHSLLNPHAFDGELRSLEEGIAGSGYVRQPRDVRWPNRNLGSRSFAPGPSIEALRTVLRDASRAALQGQRPDAAGVVVALSIGDQAAIPARWWEIFNRTGVGHLMSISGLHITMLAGMAGGLARRLLRLPAIGRPALLDRCPADRLKWAVALGVAFGYSAIAGWGIPAQRTCWMLAVAGLALLGGRSQSIGRVLALSAGVVTAIDPWAPLAAGFWLSFASVAAIVWFGTRQQALDDGGEDPGDRRAPSGWRAVAGRVRARLAVVLAEAVRTQWAATLALLPLGALFFSSFSLVGPVANAFAIPLVSIVITPLALLGTALLLPFPSLGSILLGLVCVATGWLLDALELVAGPRWAIAVLPAPSAAAVGLAALAIVALLCPFRLPGRPAAFAALLPLVAPHAPLPAAGTIRVNALDVGQGAAILIETPGGRLLFDAGPRHGVDSDAGSRVIIPYLRARGIEALDTLVISHADEDHAGGALSVLAGVRVGWVASPLDADHPVREVAPLHRRCWRGEHWQWGETRFEFLHPGPERTHRGKSATNANSCVLRIESPAGVVLLTGDIEAAQEGFLVEKLGAPALRADLLVAPHHGSNGSSSMVFLNAVQPSIAIAQAGYRNRFGHPGEKARIRYRAAGVELLRTDEDGAVTVILSGARQPPLIERLRHDARRYWRLKVQPAAARLIARSSRRPWPRPRREPDRRPASTGRARARRVAAV